MDRTFTILEVVNDNTLSRLLAWLRACYQEDPEATVFIKIEATTDRADNKAILHLWQQIKAMPHPPIHTYAGMDTWYGGALIFLMGDFRELKPDISMRFEWNGCTRDFIAERTGMEVQELFSLMVTNRTLNQEYLWALNIATEKPFKLRLVG